MNRVVLPVYCASPSTVKLIFVSMTGTESISSVDLNHLFRWSSAYRKTRPQWYSLFEMHVVGLSPFTVVWIWYVWMWVNGLSDGHHRDPSKRTHLWLICTMLKFMTGGVLRYYMVVSNIVTIISVNNDANLYVNHHVSNKIATSCYSLFFIFPWTITFSSWLSPRNSDRTR